MWFQNCSILLLEEKHLPISVQCLSIVLFVFCLTVFSQNRFPTGTRSALPLAPFISVVAYIVIRSGSFVTACIRFWAPLWHPSWFKKILCTLMFIVSVAKHYGFGQMHEVMCPLPQLRTKWLFISVCGLTQSFSSCVVLCVLFPSFKIACKLHPCCCIQL